MSQNKNCIISFANKNGNYAQGLARLSDSLRNNFEGDFLAWMHESALYAPLHSENPYAFKVYAFQKAFDLGYENVLWLDCSAYAVQNVQPIFDLMSKDGYFFQEAGHLLGEWSNDGLLHYFNFDRDTAMSIPMVMGGIIGINSKSSVLSSLEVAMDHGLFKGNWSNDNNSESNDSRCKGHRHEMSTLSAIAHKDGLKWQPQVIQHAGFFDKTESKTIIKFQGL